jgi:5'-nucleotidase
LRALEEVARTLGEVVVSAPQQEMSHCSHRTTTGMPLMVRKDGERHFAVAGTTADCVRLGLFSLAADADWILSGINRGGNLGADVYHSGTVAGVREAALHGRAGAAFSHYHRPGRAIDWEQAGRWALRVMSLLLAEQPASRSGPVRFWNVNFPHLDPSTADPEIVFCPLDPNPLPLSYSEHEGAFLYDGDYHNRARRSGSDVDVCFGGRIAVTEMNLG